MYKLTQTTMAASNPAEVSANISIKKINLNEIELNKNLTQFHPMFSKVDELRKQIYYLSTLLKSTWGKSEIITIFIGSLAVVLGAFTFDGELSEGGDFLKVGISPLGDGLSAISPASFFQLILSLICWIYFIYRLWEHYPLMKGQSVSLLFMWFSITVMNISLHQGAPSFPLEFSTDGITITLGSLIMSIFLGFVFTRAVVETRDIHVEEKFQDPDPRVVADALYNHSLLGWVGILFIWTASCFVSSWAGTHYVSVRPHGSFIWQITYIFFGIISVAGMCILLWYPQFLLGSGEIKIKSKRAREIDDLEITMNFFPEQGKCPECNHHSSVSRDTEGLPKIKCPTENCQGEGTINTKCNLCSEKLPSRVICTNCGVSSPALKHLSDQEAW